MNARGPGSAAQGDQNTHAAAAGFRSSAAAWVQTDGAAPEGGSGHRPLSTVAHQPGVIADPALLPLLRVLARIAQRCATSTQIASAQGAAEQLMPGVSLEELKQTLERQEPEQTSQLLRPPAY